MGKQRNTMENNSSAPANPASTTETAQPGTEAQTPAVAAQPTPTEIKKMKLKIDGKEQELPEDEVIRYAQQGKAANQRFEEASRMRKEAQDMVNLIKTNPMAVLNDPRIGVNFRELAEQYLAEQLKQEMMTPEQKRVAEMEKQMKTYKDRDEQERTQAEQIQYQKMVEHYAKEYETKITSALAENGIPKTPFSAKRMAYWIEKSEQNGMDVSPKDLARLVKEDFEAEFKAMYDSADEDQLLALLGKNADKIRKADLKRLKNPTAPVQQAPKAVKSSSTPTKKQTPDDFFKSLKKQY